MRVAIYTADVGGYDEPLHVEPQDEGPVSAVWFEPVSDPPVHGSDQVRSRWVKWHPHEVVPEEYDWTIWVDACVRIESSTFAAEAIEAIGDASMGVIRHPFWTDIDAELQGVEALPGCQGHHHRAMVDRLAPFFVRGPVVGLGVIIRRHGATRPLDEAVWAFLEELDDARCRRDQLAFPFAWPSSGVDVTVLDPPGGDYWANDYWVRRPHRAR